MLAVGVHRQRVGEARRRRGTNAVQHRGAFARVDGELEHAQPGIRRRERREALAAAVGAAVQHDPDRVPVRARRAHRLHQDRAGVVARDEDEMGRGGLHGRRESRSAQAVRGFLARYSEKTPSSTCRETSAKPAAASVRITASGGTQASIVSQ